MNTTTQAKSDSRSLPSPRTVKAFTILPGDTGCEWVRLLHPGLYLNRNGMSFKVLLERDLPRLKYTGLPEYNVFIMSRRTPKKGNLDDMLKLIKIEQARGVKVVYEIDDDPFSHRFYPDPEPLKVIFGAVDDVIVSTLPLAKRIAPYSRRMPFVVQNYVDGELWDFYPREFHAQEIVIGLSGSATHYDDWSIVSDALHRIGEKHPHVRFVTFGYTPDYLADLPRLTKIPAVPYSRYPGPLKTFDIGLAPLIHDDDDFNLYKSPIKALDYMVAGAAALCSNHPVYRQVEGNKRVNDDEWFDVLDFYVSNPVELERLKRRGEKWARKNRLLATGWREFATALRRIIKQ
jgi:hypothetical protein